MHKLAIVYFPKINLYTVDNLRKKYDINYKIISPHITVVSPIETFSRKDLLNHVEKVASKTKSFSIQLVGLKKTLDGCLFLMVSRGADKIIKLHDKLYTNNLTSYLSAKYIFEPHITLGDFRNPNDRNLDKAFSQAQKIRFDLRCKFDSLYVIEGNGVNPSKIIKTIQLKGF